MLDLGVKTIAVTLGEEGCEVHSAEGEKRVPGFRMKVVDTTGAGDAFAAGFLHGMLGGMPIDRCARIGNAVGALNCRAIGARVCLPTREELDEFLTKEGL